jgi:uroporphyrinogen-III synthase
MSLSGKTIVITRDANHAQSFANILKAHQVNIILFPTIKISNPGDTTLIKKVVRNISNFHWIIFTSAFAIRFFMKHINSIELKRVKIACVGNKTAKELSIYNLTASLIPREYTSKNLLTEMKRLDLKNNQILIPCSNLSGSDLKIGLENVGAKVKQIIVYNNEPFINPNKIDLQKQIENNLVDCLTFFSPSAVNSFIKIMDKEIVALIKQLNLPIAVIGSTTEVAVLEQRLKPTIKPIKSDNQGMVEALSKFFADE